MRVPALVVACLLLSSAATADVLTEDNASILCVDAGDGTRVVDRDVLAHLISAEAGAGIYLDGANVSGARDWAIQLRTAPGVLSEPSYAVVNAGRCAKAVDRPFGPKIDLAEDERALAVCEQIEKTKNELNRLIDRGPFDRATVRYRVVHRAGAGAQPGGSVVQSATLLFVADPTIAIACERPPADGEESETEDESEPATEATWWQTARKSFRLRGKVKDLNVGTKSLAELKNVDPATIGFERDGESGTTTFTVNGVAGFRYPQMTGRWDLIPFFSYEYRAVTADDGDNINKIAPGLLGGYNFTGTSWVAQAKLEGTWIEEQVTDSTQAKLRIYADPVVALPDKWGVLFGGNLKKVGPMVLRPDLTLIFDASHVFDAGSSSELAKASNYYGLGGQLSLRLEIDYGDALSEVSFAGGLRGLALFGDIHNDDVRRWYGSIDYAPDDLPYFGIGVSVSRGENDDTFQDEELYSINTTLRY